MARSEENESDFERFIPDVAQLWMKLPAKEKRAKVEELRSQWPPSYIKLLEEELGLETRTPHPNYKPLRDYSIPELLDELAQRELLAKDTPPDILQLFIQSASKLRKALRN